MNIENAEQYQFFRSLDVSVVELIVNQLLLTKAAKVDENHELLVDWSDFFDLFCKLRESATQQAINIARSKWHPSTMGFAMEKATKSISQAATSENEQNSDDEDDAYVSDDYTEDDASESSEPSITRESKRGKRLLESEAIPLSEKVENHGIHPVFQGYTLLKSKELETQRKEKQKLIYQREVRAITKARKFCEDRLHLLEKQIQNQSQVRLEKITKLKTAFDETTFTRKRDFDNSVVGTTEDIAKAMTAQFEKENNTLRAAFQYELEELEKNHKHKGEAEAQEISIKQHELRMLVDAEQSILGSDVAFNDSNSSESIQAKGLSEPNAARLEEFAKIEMNRCAKAVTESTTALQRVSAEYKLLKDELAGVLSDTSEQVKKNPAAMKKLQEARSMMNVAETRLKEAAKQTKQVVEELNDCEALLSQATWRKNQEEELLPLFTKFMISPTTYTANKKKIIIALILLAIGNFEQKFDLLMKIAKVSAPSTVSSNGMMKGMENTLEQQHYQTIFTLLFILQFVKMTYEVLTTISLIPFHRIDKDLENYLKRNYTKMLSEGDEGGGSSSHIDETTAISEYEMKALLIKVIIYLGAESPFGVTSTIFQIPSTGSLSNYSLLQASSLSLLKHGINDFISTAKDIHYASIAFKPELENNHKRDIHEAALSMGNVDPFKPDYTKFFLKQEALKSYYIIPHDNRQFTSVEYYQQRQTWKYVIKVQAMMRAYMHRQISWKIAKCQAYVEAKHTAIKQLKTKMLKEFQKRENSKGLGKMKWDAEVRMKQAKLRAMGQSVNRSETVMIMMEESIQQAKGLIEEKFQEMLIQEKLIHYLDRNKLFEKKVHYQEHHPTITPPIHLHIDCEVIDSLATSTQFDRLLMNNEPETGAVNSLTLALNPESDHPEDSQSNSNPQKGENSQEPVKELSAIEIKKQKEAEEFEAMNEKVQAALQAMGGRIQKKLFDVRLLPIHLRPKTINRATMIKLLQGYYAHVSREQYENQLEAMIRLSLSSETTSTFDLYHRLRFLHKRITSFKAMEIISEFPSKRLFLQYLRKNTKLQLLQDLQEQFKFKYEIPQVMMIFQRLLMSDIDQGLLLFMTLRLQEQQESGLIRIANDYYQKILRIFTKYLDLKLESSGGNQQGKTIAACVQEEYEQTIEQKQHIQSLIDSQYRKIQEEQGQLQRLLLSFGMQQEKLVMIRNHPSFQNPDDAIVGGEKGKGGGDLNGKKKKRLTTNNGKGKVSAKEEVINNFVANPIEAEQEVLKNVTREIRTNWMLRYQQAMKLITNPETMYQGMLEIQMMLPEFMEMASQGAKTIIQELYLSEAEKTIPVYQSRKINGREQTRRGIDGKKSNYYASGIFYEICLDYDGVFNGSDEYAAKLGGKERLGAQMINDTQTIGMMAPLTVTVDYFGFRIVATAKLPIMQYTFSEDGLIKRMKVEVLHGLSTNGDNFINKHRIAYSLFRQMSTKLNLLEHEVKGKLDFSYTATYGGHLAFYKSHQSSASTQETEEFYVRNCWNIFPHELSSTTLSHLSMTPQDQAIFWRYLRPEFVSQYVKPLSTDAGSIICYQSKEEAQQLQDLSEATIHLFTEIIPKVTLQLISRYSHYYLQTSSTFTIQDGEMLVTELHKQGINLRHLGLIRSLLWRKLPTICSIYHYEDIMYTTTDVSNEVQYGDFLRIGEEIFTIQKTEKHEISSMIIPLHTVYNGDSLHETEVYIGKLDYPYQPSSSLSSSSPVTTIGTPEVMNSDPLRQLLLVEMVARTLKQVIRYQLREFVEQNHYPSTAYEKYLFTYYCNALTGANTTQLPVPIRSSLELGGGNQIVKSRATTPQLDPPTHSNTTQAHSSSTAAIAMSPEKFFHEIIFMNVRERFGPQALLWSERKDLIPQLQCQLPYLIHRLSKMLGIQYALATMIRFQANPIGFIFIPEDIQETIPIAHHNITYYPFYEAMILAKRGQEILANSYQNLVLASKPLLFYPLSERKGSKQALNYGLLGKEYSGKFHDGCMLEQSGPITGEKFIRSIAFRASTQSCIDIPADAGQYLPIDALSHFSVELFFNCLGGQENKRTILRNGRYHLGISRDNQVFFTFYESVHTLSLDLFPVKLYQWEHLLITYDGTTLRIYHNGQLLQAMEIERYFFEREYEYQLEYQQSKQQLAQEEQKEIMELKPTTIKEATAYFTTKEGIAMLKRMAQTILEDEPEENLPNAASIAAKGGGDGNINRINIQRERKAWATKKAKEQYIEETYQTNIQQLQERYRQLLIDLETNHDRQLMNAEEASQVGLRIGASHPDANNRHGDAYFIGNISCVALYDYCLSVDQIRQHYLASKRNIYQDVQRIYHEAIVKFHTAIEGFTFTSEGYLPFMSMYSHCLLYLLQLEPKEREVMTTISIVSELYIIIDLYLSKQLLEPLVILLNEIPRDPEFAELIVTILLSLKQVNRFFLSRTAFINRSQLVYLPMEFGLLVPNRPKRYYEAAAYLFQEICRDVQYGYIYGDIDLQWITELRHEKLIISLVQTAYESRQMKILELAKFYDYLPSTTSSSSSTSNTGMHQSLSFVASTTTTLRDRLSLYRNNNNNNNNNDQTSATISNNTTGINPTGAIQSLTEMAQKKLGLTKPSIQMLLEDYNPLYQERDHILATIDEDVQVLSYHLPNLEGLDLSYFISLTDFAMEYIKRFASLKILLLNECYELTDTGLIQLHKAFPYLEQLSLQRLIQITNEGLIGFSQGCSNLQVININYCIQVSLQPIIEIMKTNRYLHTLGLANTRITDEELVVASIYWKESIQLMHLDISYCQQLTDQGILVLSETCRQLKTLNMKGLQRVTTMSIQAIANRCWLLEKWYLDDIYLITDQGFLYNASLDGRSLTSEQMLSHIKILSLNYCDHLQNNALKYLAERNRCLQVLQLSGCYQLTDHGFQYLTDPLLCPMSTVSCCQTLRSLSLAYVTKLSQRQLIEIFQQTIILERIDLSGLANIVTDELIQQMCQLLPSLQALKVNACIQLTNLSLCSIAQSLWLEELQMNGCQHITNEGLEVLGETCLGLKILHIQKIRGIQKITIAFIQKNCPILQELLYDEYDIDSMNGEKKKGMKNKSIQQNELDASHHSQEKDKVRSTMDQIQQMKRVYPELAEEDQKVSSLLLSKSTSMIPNKGNNNHSNLPSGVNTARGTTTRPSTSQSYAGGGGGVGSSSNNNNNGEVGGGRNSTTRGTNNPVIKK